MTVYSGINLTQTYSAAMLTDGSTPNVGTIAWVGNKAYKFVQYNSGVGTIAGVAGNVTFYYAPSGVSAGSVTVVTSDVSDSAGLGAGVLQAAVATGEFCWIQIKGPATITPALTSGGDGNALTAGAADSTLKIGTLVTDSVVAYAIDASAKIIMCDFPF